MNATNPIGVMPMTPIATAIQPHHLGRRPVRTTASPLEIRKITMPIAIGMKSLSHSACSACTAVGSTSSAASASANEIVMSTPPPTAMIPAPTRIGADVGASRISMRRWLAKKTRRTAPIPPASVEAMIESLLST